MEKRQIPQIPDWNLYAPSPDLQNDISELQLAYSKNSISTIDDAIRLKNQIKNLFLIGFIGGYPITTDYHWALDVKLRLLPTYKYNVTILLPFINKEIDNWELDVLIPIYTQGEVSEPDIKDAVNKLTELFKRISS